MLIETSIFDYQLLRQVNLTVDDETLQKIIDDFQDEIQKLLHMDEKQIIEELKK